LQTEMLTDIRSDTPPFWALPDEKKPFFYASCSPAS